VTILIFGRGDSAALEGGLKAVCPSIARISYVADSISSSKYPLKRNCVMDVALGGCDARRSIRRSASTARDGQHWYLVAPQSAAKITPLVLSCTILLDGEFA
jgi:hypothetical protein